MAYQIPYHELDAPLNPPIFPPEYSSLHMLYPGVPMPRTEVYDRYNIPHQCQEAARKSFEERKEDTIKAARHLEKLARLGSGDKVTIHDVADPSIPTEDPALLQLSTQAPISLNEGMEYPAKPEKSKKGKKSGKEGFDFLDAQPASGQETKEQQKGIPRDIGAVFLFAGFLVLVLMLYGAFVKKV
jgi:hypothetical protein